MNATDSLSENFNVAVVFQFNNFFIFPQRREMLLTCHLKRIDLMGTKYLFLSCLFLIFVLFLTSTLAQDYVKQNLSEGPKMRLGKGDVNDLKFSPDSNRVAVASSCGISI